MYKNVLKIMLALTLITVMLFSSSVAVFAQTDVESTSYSVDYNEENYTTDYSEMVAILKTAFLNRDKNALLKFAMDEELDGTTLHNLVDTWVEEALVVTDKADEGDYIRLHLSAYGTSAGRFWSNDSITYYYHIPYEIEYYTTYEQEQTVTKKVEEIVNGFGFTDATTDKEKCDAIYDYITKNVRYDTENKTNADYKLKFSAYAALINKTAVCQGYATLFYRLAKESGLSVRVITGESYGERHSWNIVKIGDYYYYVDSTWDEGKTTYSYYLKGTDTFLHHTSEDKFNTAEFKAEYPISKKSYSEESGDICTSGHIYGGECDSTCNVCSAVRDAITSHTYDNESDAVCNQCGDTRDLGYDYKLNLNQQLNLKYSLSGDFEYRLSDETIAKIDKITTSESDGLITKTATIVPLKSGYVTVEIISGGNVLGKTVLYVVGCEHPVMSTQVITNATCTEDGTAVQKCTLCDYSKNVVIAKIGHKFDNTCDATCNACSYVRSASHELIWKIDKAESCGVNGLKHQECTTCGAKQSENTVISATGNHTYNNACDNDCNVCGNLRSVPDHVYDNSADESCNICGEIRGITHNYIWVTDKAATCAENGIKHEECVDCGIKRNENTVIEATGNHTYSNACDKDCNVCGNLRSVPDHVYDNSADESCNICGEIRGITHNYIWVTDKAATCGVNGIKHEECVDCGKVKNENTVILATGNHSYIWIIDLKETCGTKGIKHEECSVCGLKQNENTEILPRGEHSYDDIIADKCNVCGLTREIIPDQILSTDKTMGLMYTHTEDFTFVLSDETIAQITDLEVTQSIVDGVITKTVKATIIPLKPGYVILKIVTASNKTIALTLVLVEEGSHQMQLVEVIKKANCTEDGSEKHICKFCGYAQTVTVNKMGHKYDNATDTKCNVCGDLRDITPEQKITTDQKTTLQFSLPMDFEVELSDNTVAKIENIDVTQQNVQGSIFNVASVTIAPLKPGYVSVMILDTNHRVIAESLILVQEGNHKMQLVEVIETATCEAKGKEKHVCEYCGLEQIIVTDKKAHQFTDNVCVICGAVRENLGQQLIKEDGKVYYYVDGEKSDITDLVEFKGQWIYVKDGVFQQNVSALQNINGKCYLIMDGILNKTTGLVEFEENIYYLINGVWSDAIADTLYKIGGKWYYIKDGKFAKDSTTLVKYNEKWYYVKKGLKNTATTLVKYNGKWYYVEKGVKSTKTTLVKYNGTWYYVKDGKKNTSTTLVKYNGVWYYVKSGKKNTATTLVKYNGTWYYVKSGKKSTATTLCKYNGKYYYVKSGKKSTSTAIVKYNGKKYYVKKGIAQTGFSGKVKISGKKYTVKKGIVK